MRDAREIAADLESFEFDRHADMRLNQLAGEIEKHPEGAKLVRAILSLFEKFPNEDFGMPGPLAHVAERFYRRGYEDELAVSLRRSPTSLTIWLANRIVNANDSNSSRFLELLMQISERSDLDATLTEEARNFVALHN
jgi:hypothetical protein